MQGMAESIMHDADLDRFARVSEDRVGRNRPQHLGGAEPTAAAAASQTSLASTLVGSQT